MPNMTDKQYVKTGGGTCPLCKCNQVTGDDIDFNGATLTQEVSCDKCEGRWLDIYRLTGYDIISDPKETEKDEEGQ